jgi:hypothetical protein
VRRIGGAIVYYNYFFYQTSRQLNMVNFIQYFRYGGRFVVNRMMMVRVCGINFSFLKQYYFSNIGIWPIRDAVKV